MWCFGMEQVRNIVFVFFIYLVFFISAVLLARELTVNASDELAVSLVGFEERYSQISFIDFAETASSCSGNAKG